MEPITSEKINEIDEQAGKVAETVENTTLGRQVPREISKLKPRDLGFCAIIAKIILAIPIAIFTFDEKYESTTGSKFVSWALYILILADSALSLIHFFNLFKFPYVVCMATAGCALLLTLIMFTMHGMAHKLTSLYILLFVFFLLYTFVTILNLLYSHMAAKEENEESQI